MISVLSQTLDLGPRRIPWGKEDCCLLQYVRYNSFPQAIVTFQYNFPAAQLFLNTGIQWVSSSPFTCHIIYSGSQSLPQVLVCQRTLGNYFEASNNQ